MKTQVISFDYIREQVKTGIMHIGVGNFHRAHEEFYTNRLLAEQLSKTGESVVSATSR